MYYLISTFFFRSSDITSSLGGLKSKLRDYDTGAESGGEDLDEIDFNT